MKNSFASITKSPAFRLGVLLMLLIGSTSCSRNQGHTEGSNLLLITMDTTRADALGCYGGPAWATPNLDGLAREGIRFDQARSVTPLTLPSHATILTGLQPFEHGIRDNANFRLPREVTTMAERLQSEGYATYAVSGAFVLHSTFGLDQGFDVYSDVPRRKLNMGTAEDQRTAKEVVDEALKIMESERKNAFFLWVHLFDPHLPYAPPESFYRKSLQGAPASRLSEFELKRRKYAGEVAYMDQEIGRLIEGLHEIFPESDIITAVVADHGEGLGDHGEETHAFQLYDTTVKVPMILYGSGIPEGKVIDQLVSVTDLAPTVMSLLGYPFSEATGADLSPLINEERGKPEDSLVYFESAHPYYNYNWSPLYGITDGRFKYISGPEPELYDIVEDPRERTNLLGKEVAQADALWQTIRSLSPRTRKPHRIKLDAEDQSRIEALGYAGSAVQSTNDPPIHPGSLHEGLRDPKEGMEILDLCTKARSLSMSPNKKDKLKAVELIKEVLKSDPRNPTFLAHAGTIYFHAGRFTEAMSAARRSLDQLESPTSRELLATCLFNTGRIDAAIEQLQINYELHPHDLISRYKLGDALLRKGRAKESLVHLNFFLDLYEARDGLFKSAEQMRREAKRLLR